MADLNLTPIDSEMDALQTSTPEPSEATALTAEDPAVLNKKIATNLKSRLENSISNKKTFLNEWKRNVETRLGQPVPLYTEGLDVDADLQSAINPDWSLTKTKTANLFSQVPTIRGTHVSEQYAPAIAPFLKQLNYELGPKRAHVAVAMNECLNDVVNASGIAAAIVSYSARFEDVPMAAEDPLLPAPPPMAPPVAPVPPAPAMQGEPPAAGAPPMAPGAPAAPMAPPAPPAGPAMTNVSRPVSEMLNIKRISPRDLLWAAEFIGSDFNDSDFIGHRDRIAAAVGAVEFKLDEDQLRKALTTSQEDGSTSLRSTQNKAHLEDVDLITYSELFYWRYRQDPNEKNFKAIWRLVYIDGLPEPVIHEPWKGQQFDPQTRQYVGACKYPIQVLTLTYITDNPVPPSDSAAGRPQVNDMRRSRSQMFQNRQRSIPIRWFDVNRIDQDLQGNLMRGVVQGMIPTNGSGERAIGEIARASYPSENLEFDAAAKTDLMESWQIGPNQTGTTQPGRHTADEANIVQQNFTTRIGQERAFVANFLLNLADVLGGFLCLYSDFPILTPDEKQAMLQAWDQKHILADLVLNIVPDSTVMLDADQQIAKIMKVINMTVQSGFVNPEPLIAQVLELSGLDPAKIMTKPPQKEEKPNISYRFSGKDDLQNPLVVALMMKEGLFPSDEDIAHAKKVLDEIALPAPPPPPPGMPPGPGGPEGPGGPKPPEPPNGQQPPAHPNWQMAPKIASRSREMGGA